MATACWWKQATMPARVVMIGDGISDLETKSDVDIMVGFGGVLAREKVKQGADAWWEAFTDTVTISSFLE